MEVSARKEGRGYSRRSVCSSAGVCAWMVKQRVRVVVVAEWLETWSRQRDWSQRQVRPGIRPTLNAALVPSSPALERRLRGFVELSARRTTGEGERLESSLDSLPPADKMVYVHIYILLQAILAEHLYTSLHKYCPTTISPHPLQTPIVAHPRPRTASKDTRHGFTRLSSACQE